MEAARWLVVFVALVTAIGGLLADYFIPWSGRQHIKNPAWPPHAKFHNGQTILMGLALGVLGHSRFTLLGLPACCTDLSRHCLDRPRVRANHPQANGFASTAAYSLRPLGHPARSSCPGSSVQSVCLALARCCAVGATRPSGEPPLAGTTGRCHGSWTQQSV